MYNKILSKLTQEEQVEFLLEQVNLYRFDYLTGLKMRRDFNHELREKLCTDRPFVLAYYDVDGLHNVNRLQSEQAGDALIRQVADDIRFSPSTLHAFRFSGDEFYAISSTTPTAIQNATCVYIISEDFETAEEMIIECGRLLTEAKTKNKNRRTEDRV